MRSRAGFWKARGKGKTKGKVLAETTRIPCRVQSGPRGNSSGCSACVYTAEIARPCSARAMGAMEGGAITGWGVRRLGSRGLRGQAATPAPVGDPFEARWTRRLVHVHGS
jgi:hypothetical protein